MNYTIFFPLFLLLFMSKGLFGQIDFQTGYIIQTSGDTLFGEIDYRGSALMSRKCRFRLNESSDVQTFLPAQIVGYRFPNSKFYVSKEVNNEAVFLEFLIQGKVNMYFLKDETQVRYFLEKENVPLTALPYHEQLITKDTRNYYLPSKTHIMLLKQHLADAPQIQDQIESIEEPEHDALVRLAKTYHYAVCEEGEECIIYKKKLPPVKVKIELVFAGLDYSAPTELANTIYGQSGLIFHLWLPRANEKLYVRTGILRSKTVIQEFGLLDPLGYWLHKAVKVPFQLEYIYPKGIIRPRLAYGVIAYKFDIDPSLISLYTVAANAGLNIQLSKKLHVSLTSDIEFFSQALIFPNRHLSTGIMGGIFLKI